MPAISLQQLVLTPARIGENSGQHLRLASFVSRPFNVVYVAVSLLLLCLPTGFHLLGTAMLLNFATVQGIKQLCWLPRPNASAPPRWGHGPRSGFPSGHTTPAFLLASMMTAVHPQLALPWFAAAAAIGWSRVRVGAHHPYQVVISALLGCALAALTFFTLG